MENLKSIKSIAYVLSGSLLYQYNGVAGGWTSGLAAIFGFVLFIVGLDLLKSGLDDIGQRGVSLMRIGGLVGGVSALIDLIPMFGWFSGIGFAASFVLILLGLLRLKTSSSIEGTGREGVSRLVFAMVVSITTALISLFPFFGGFVASLFALLAMYLSFSGWFKIQNGLAVNIA